MKKRSASLAFVLISLIVVSSIVLAFTHHPQEGGAWSYGIKKYIQEDGNKLWKHYSNYLHHSLHHGSTSRVDGHDDNRVCAGCGQTSEAAISYTNTKAATRAFYHICSQSFCGNDCDC